MLGWACRAPMVMAMLAAAGMVGPVSARAQEDVFELPLEQLEQVIVVARKRGEAMQSVPISVTAVSGEALQRAGVPGTDELSVLVPGLQTGRQIGFSTPFLRGVGHRDSSIGSESSVSLYVDGVYYPALSTGIQDFNNIERVEVVKGPQGTLFGRNATGGLIHIITRDPQSEPDLRLRVGYGNYDTLSLALYGTTAVGSRVSTDLSLTLSDAGEGWGRNRVTGRDTQPEELSVLRNKWLYAPSEETRAQLSLGFSRKRGGAGISRQPAPGTVGIDGESTFTGRWHDVESHTRALFDVEQYSAALQIERKLSMAELVSITAFIESDEFNRLDQDSIGPNLLNIPFSSSSRTVSQELHLSAAPEGPFSWIAGAFLMAYDARYDPLQLSRAAGTILDLNLDSDLRTMSLFAEGYYDVTEATSLTAGARWTSDTREIDGHNRFASGAMARFRAQESWEEPSWRLALNHSFSNDVMGYLSYSRGFKSGSFNTFVSSGELGPAVEPETLDAYEAGLKSDLLGERLRVNLAAFRYRYDDLQIQQVIAGGTLLLNAAKASIAGFELEGVVAPRENLDMRFAAAVLRTEFDEFADGPVYTPSPTGGNVRSSGDLAGNDLPRAPDFTLSASVSYGFATPFGQAELAATYYYNDGFAWEPDNRFRQDGYHIVNAQASLAGADGGWVLRLFGTNLLDEEYSYYSVSQTFGDLLTAAPPRMYGMSLEVDLR